MEAQRKRKQMSRQALADRLNVTAGTVFRWEKNQRTPSDKDKERIANALETSVAYLMGEKNESEPPRTELTPIHTDPSGWKPLPLFSSATAACAGGGYNLSSADPEIESWHYFPSEIYGKWNEERKPYMIPVEGNSMEEADIPDGASVIVNPAEEVYDGESALVSWNDGNTAVKLVYWLPDGGVELQAANPEHKKIYTFSKEDIENGLFQLRGKIMWSGNRPRRMR
jgi:phage repressor protein C with HTH and peptisase S24 domain